MTCDLRCTVFAVLNSISDIASLLTLFNSVVKHYVNQYHHHKCCMYGRTCNYLYFLSLQALGKKVSNVGSNLHEYCMNRQVGAH